MVVSTESGESALAESPAPADQPGRTARITGWVAGALVLGLLIGLGVGLVLPRLTRPGDSSVEAGFLRDMSTHHAQAVEMAMIAHAGSTNVQIVSLASDIALTQQAQIGIMLAWLRGWGLGSTGSQPVMAWMPDSAGAVQNGLMPGMASPEQMTKLRAATGKDLDVQFLTLMRQHHLGGIHMTQEILKLTDNADVVWLAQAMLTAQQGEIDLIQQLLAQLQKTG